MADDRVKFYEGSPTGWTSIIDANINGPFHMAYAVVQTMLQQKSGRILNVTKSRSSMYRPNESPYGPSKAALEAMTLCWAQDLLDSGVTVNSIAPGGAVETEFVLPAVRAKASQTPKPYLPAEIIVPPLFGSHPMVLVRLQVAGLSGQNGILTYHPMKPQR